MVDLTVLIITKNEEANLTKCINSFRGIAKRFVVVDSFSTDSTVKIAKSLGAAVYKHPFVDHATQVNWGLKNTEITTTWVMRIDADEELTIELAEELEHKLEDLDPEITALEVKRRVYFMNRWIQHGGVYPMILLRIFRTGKAYCEETLMDEHMVLMDGKTLLLKNDLIDNNAKGLEAWITKHNWYSGREVTEYLHKREQLDRDMAIKPKIFGNNAERKRWLKYIVYYKTPLMHRAHWYFIYRYFLKLGFLDGKEGLIFHFLQGYWYRFLVDAKIHEKLIHKD